jgi:hypothetical protein
MSNATRDENRKTSLIAVSTLDTDSIVKVTANPDTGALLTEGVMSDDSITDRQDISNSFLNTFEEQIDSLVKEPDSNELLTVDSNLRQVFGTQRVFSQTGKLNVNPIPDIFTQKSNLKAVTNSTQIIDVENYNSLSVQLSGTWAGTIQFEASADRGTFTTIYGLGVNATALVTTTTTSGIWRFNVAGIKLFQVKFTTATSGNPIVNFNASVEPSSIITNPVTGSLVQPISQKATSFETNTYDTNLATVVGLTQLYQTGFELESIRINAPTLAPTQPAAFVSNMFKNYPQRFRRLRVEAAGDQRLAFAQEENTNKLITVNHIQTSLLEQILQQLIVLNNLMYKSMDYNGMPGLDIPSGFVELSKN